MSNNLAQLLTAEFSDLATQSSSMMIMMDPPMHERLRKLVNRAFTPRIELPADLHDRVAAVQEKAVSNFAFGCIRHGPVEYGECNGAATIYDVEESNTVSPAEIAGPQDHQVGRHLDFPIAVPSRFLEIRDHLISLVSRIDEEIELPG